MRGPRAGSVELYLKEQNTRNLRAPADQWLITELRSRTKPAPHK